jgi:probable HAF family extracellular repeat protein
MKKIATTALLVFALLIAQIGQAQTVTTAAKPESPAKKPSPPTEINYTVTEAFPLEDRFIGALNRSGELALIGDFAASFVDKKRKVTDFECLIFSNSGAVDHFTTPLGINNNGDIVGFCHDNVGPIETGFLRSKSGSLSQFTAPGATSTVANGVNDFGQIVGQSSGISGTFSFIRSPDGTQYQNILPPTTEALVQAVAINNSLKVVGHFTDNSGQHAFLWDNGQFTELRVPGASNSNVRQLNNNDQALMFATVAGIGSHYLYSDGNYLRINNPEGYTWQNVIALNDDGELAGSAFNDQNVSFDIIAKPRKK